MGLNLNFYLISIWSPITCPLLFASSTAISLKLLLGSPVLTVPLHACVKLPQIPSWESWKSVFQQWPRDQTAVKPSPKPVHRVRSPSRSTLVICVDTHGFLRGGFVPHIKAFDAHLCCDILRHLTENTCDLVLLLCAAKNCIHKCSCLTKPTESSVTSGPHSPDFTQWWGHSA